MYIRFWGVRGSIAAPLTNADFSSRIADLASRGRFHAIASRVPTSEDDCSAFEQSATKRRVGPIEYVVEKHDSGGWPVVPRTIRAGYRNRVVCSSDVLDVRRLAGGDTITADHTAVCVPSPVEPAT